MKSPKATIAILLSQSIGAVAIVNCKPVGRVGGRTFQVKLDARFGADHDLRKQDGIFIETHAVGVETTTEFNGKQITCGYGDNIKPVTGHLGALTGLEGSVVKFTNVGRREDFLAVNDISHIFVVSAEEQQLAGKFHVREELNDLFTVESQSMKAGFREFKAGLQAMLEKVSRMEAEALDQGAVESESTFVAEVNEDGELVVSVSGATNAMSERELRDDCQIAVNGNLRRAFELRKAEAEKAKLAEQMAALDQRIAGMQ